MPTRIVVTGVLLVLGLLAALLPLVADSGEPREIRIVARRMSFYADGAAASNPAIRLEPGERVRLTLVNDDAGVDHDFAVNAWSLATPLLKGQGSASMLFTAPSTPGRTDYVCTRHLAMMTGVIEVASRR